MARSGYFASHRPRSSAAGAIERKQSLQILGDKPDTHRGVILTTGSRPENWKIAPCFRRWKRISAHRNFPGTVIQARKCHSGACQTPVFVCCKDLRIQTRRQKFRHVVTICQIPSPITRSERRNSLPGPSSTRCRFVFVGDIDRSTHIFQFGRCAWLAVGRTGNLHTVISTPASNPRRSKSSTFDARNMPLNPPGRVILASVPRPGKLGSSAHKSGGRLYIISRRYVFPTLAIRQQRPLYV